MTRKGVLYVRVSSKEQEEEGYSLDAQVEQGRDSARRHDVEIVKTWAVAESAKDERRAAFAELVDFMRAHRDVTVMLFEKADRMTRNFFDLVRIYELVEKHDKEIFFFRENYWISKDSRSSDKMRLDFQVVMARQTINNLSEEVKKGMHQKAKQGGFPGLAPIGYVNNLQTHELDVDEQQARIVMRMFVLYATGNHTLTELAGVARKEGLVFRHNGKTLCRGAIYHMLTNPIYFGMVRWGGKVTAGRHKPLVSKGLFDRVQEVLGRQNRPRTKKFAYRTIAVCGECGSSITAEHKTRHFKNGTKKTYTYYHCTGYRNGRVCTGSYMSEEDLSLQLAEPLRGLTMDHETLGAIQDALKESFADEQAYHKERVQALSSELTKIRSRLEAAYQDRLDGIITPEEFKTKAEGWRQRQAELQIELQAHESANVSYLQEASRILELAHKAHDLYVRTQDHFERRKLLDLIVSKVVISGGRAVSNLREPLPALVKLASGSGSGNDRSRWLGC